MAILFDGRHSLSMLARWSSQYQHTSRSLINPRRFLQSFDPVSPSHVWPLSYWEGAQTQALPFGHISWYEQASASHLELLNMQSSRHSFLHGCACNMCSKGGFCPVHIHIHVQVVTLRSLHDFKIAWCQALPGSGFFDIDDSDMQHAYLLRTRGGAHSSCCCT